MPKEFSPQINGLTVTYRERTALKPHPQNPNTHNAKQVERIARSIREFGWTNPVIIDEEDRIIAATDASSPQPSLASTCCQRSAPPI